MSYLNDKLKSLQSDASLSNNSNSEVLQLTNKKNQLVEELSRKGGNDQNLQQQISDLRTQIILKSNSGVTASKVSDEIADVKKQIDEEEALVNASSSTIENYNAKIHEYLGLANNMNPGAGVKLDVLKQQLE